MAAITYSNPGTSASMMNNNGGWMNTGYATKEEYMAAQKPVTPQASAINMNTVNGGTANSRAADPASAAAFDNRQVDPSQRLDMNTDPTGGPGPAGNTVHRLVGLVNKAKDIFAPSPAAAPVEAPRPMADKYQASLDNIGNMYDELIAGHNPAADLAERSSLNQLDTQRQEAERGFGQGAAGMGLKAGDAGYSALHERTMAPLARSGSGVMATLAQGRMRDQRQNLQDAAGFDAGQQNFGEGVRRFDTSFGEDKRRFDTGQENFSRSFDRQGDQQALAQLNDIISHPDNYSVGQVSAAKSELAQRTGLGGSSSWSTPDPNDSERMITSLTNHYISLGENPDTAHQHAVEAAGKMDPAALFKSMMDSYGPGADTGSGGGGNKGWTWGDTGNLAAPLFNPMATTRTLGKAWSGIKSWF